MRIALIGLITLSLSACGAQTDEEGDADNTAHAAVTRGASAGITPEVITYPDIEANDLFGASCAFVPEGGGLGATALAMVEGGYIKLDGKVVELPPADGTGDIGPGARMEYGADAYSFGLRVDENSENRLAPELVEYSAQLTIRDGAGDVIYDASGKSQCGA